MCSQFVFQCMSRVNKTYLIGVCTGVEPAKSYARSKDLVVALEVALPAESSDLVPADDDIALFLFILLWYLAAL